MTSSYRHRLWGIVISLVLIGLLIFSPLFAAAATLVQPLLQASDLLGHWSETSFRHLISMGIIAGFPDGTVGPDKAVTRSEFVTILGRAVGWVSATNNTAPFQDVPIAHWSAPWVALAKSKGVVLGENGLFYPDREITRAEAVTLLVRALEITPTQTLPVSFSDVPPGSWYASSISSATQFGWVQGTSPSTFEPLKPLTRGEIAVLLHRILTATTTPGVLPSDEAVLNSVQAQDKLNLAAMENGQIATFSLDDYSVGLYLERESQAREWMTKLQQQGIRMFIENPKQSYKAILKTPYTAKIQGTYTGTYRMVIEGTVQRQPVDMEVTYSLRRIGSAWYIYDIQIFDRTAAKTG